MRDAVGNAITNLDAQAAPAGEMTVVLGSGWPGILLHEAVGHGLEGDFNRKGSSAFAGRIGERVAAKGVTVLDDFAHHPTAIGLTLDAVRRRWAGRRIWAVLEPRSWSLRRAVFQSRLVDALAIADEAIVAEVFRPELIAEDDRLDPSRLVAELAARGRSARHLPGAEEIAGWLVERAAPGDVVVVMSNGGFGGLHDRLLKGPTLRAESAGHGAS